MDTTSCESDNTPNNLAKNIKANCIELIFCVIGLQKVNMIKYHQNSLTAAAATTINSSTAKFTLSYNENTDILNCRETS